jgi:hypothetical protein
MRDRTGHSGSRRYVDMRSSYVKLTMGLNKETPKNVAINILTSR